jgi:hypothetical protein
MRDFSLRTNRAAVFIHSNIVTIQAGIDELSGLPHEGSSIGWLKRPGHTHRFSDVRVAGWCLCNSKHI